MPKQIHVGPAVGSQQQYKLAEHAQSSAPSLRAYSLLDTVLSATGVLLQVTDEVYSLGTYI